ncbi:MULTISPECIES: TetR/AcrR family transcriptional regulator [Catenuloplanes]|uniref:AcrR family transcriptional regulator n=1 Tax=Catenuloplanes niger TaxID=587534 RepID=A0AAE3ZXB8_9ACTN|nr:TetR/AcrR family transcriptional regulator [Catenuloplanes niger]MDR7327784.1 AcrR family transcriptional regulator [Catenuloplanes niger]
MTEVAGRDDRRRGAQRGRIDKRAAILDAAFTVFAREGYAQACVNQIAAEAGVAKPTVYNHLTDKANLFRHAIRAAHDGLLRENLATVARLADPGTDLRQTLLAVGRDLARTGADERTWALRRLLHAEAARFPELLDDAVDQDVRRLTEALADRFARLALGGRLHLTDPTVAAEQFLALVDGPLESRSRYGTRPVTAADQEQIANAAVQTFIAAFG